MHWNNLQPTKIIIKVCIETSITLQIGLRAGCYDIDEQLIMTKVLICAIRLTSLQLIKGRLSALILLNNWFMFIVHIFSRTRSQWRWTPSSSSRSISMIQRRGGGGSGEVLGLLEITNSKNTITTITTTCSTILLQLITGVPHNCTLNWDNIR